ncbi:MAG: thioredoxin domain-containing protein, partial [Anaerolineales bacterium]
MVNHLAQTNSPYLLQHANNPVDWYPWGEEALQLARLEDKPIFLSIGYAACHWCHVMAHESFENAQIAAILNRYFVNIKVDREERPDLDDIYMAATVAMTGSGGWPLSVFLTPDLKPFYCGTYFPATPGYNRPSFPDLLLAIAQAWQERRKDILSVGEQVVQHLQQSSSFPEDSNLVLSQELLDNIADKLYQSYDWAHGGWGKAPKFPQPMVIEYLFLRALHPATKKPDGYLQAGFHVLQAMARGGMYDVIGGGFSRYSVDNLWFVPHFEKMLYDNAQLARVYLHAYLISGQQFFHQVCTETLDFVLREMRHPLGGFYSSLDADAQGEEGKYYTWEYAELAQALGENFDFFRSAYALSPAGNWEGKIILQRAVDDATLAEKFHSTLDEVKERLQTCHLDLREIRSQRVRPNTDDKIITFWNALMLQTLAEAARYLNRQDYLQAAQQNGEFLLNNLLVKGMLYRSWRDGAVQHHGYLEDYAALSLALISLYQSDAQPRWFRAALTLAEQIGEYFSDPAGGFFDTRADEE